jgi:hypothetical protein
MSTATIGAGTMAKKRGRPKGETPASDVRKTIVNLKGSKSQEAWMEALHRKTHIAKSVILRLALAEWASKNGHPPFPSDD